MSSSDEAFGWSAFRERATPMDVELLSPASELAAVLQRCWHNLDAERDATRQAAATGLAIAAEQAVLVFRLGAVLKRGEEALATAGLANIHRQLRIAQEQMVDALKATDLVVLDPLGKPFDETADMVDVIGWRHGAEFPGEVAAEPIEPIVLHNDAVVRHGRVIIGALDRQDFQAEIKQIQRQLTELERDARQDPQRAQHKAGQLHARLEQINNILVGPHQGPGGKPPDYIGPEDGS